MKFSSFSKALCRCHSNCNVNTCRKNTELLILVVSFLKKMSCYAENKDEMKMLNLVDKLIPLLGPAEGGKGGSGAQQQQQQQAPSPDLVHAVVRDDLNQMEFVNFETFLKAVIKQKI